MSTETACLFVSPRGSAGIMEHLRGTFLASPTAVRSLQRLPLWWGVLVTVVLGCLRLVASDPVPAFSASVRVRGLTNEVIHLKVDAVRKGFAKRGFFSIGALPVVRLHGVELTLESGQGMSHLDAAFSRLRSWASDRSVEFHDVHLCCQRDPFFRIEAGRIDRISDRTLVFGGRTRVILAATTNEFERAEFQLSDGLLTIVGAAAVSGTNRLEIPISPSSSNQGP